MSTTESLRDRIAYGAYATAERLAMALPEPWGRQLFDLGGEAAFRLAPGARRVVEENLSRVLGRDPGTPLVRAAARESFHSYARYWYDTFRIRVIPDEDFLSRTQFNGAENFDRALEGGHGAVVASPHLGNWDVAGKWVSLAGFGITAVAETLRPERLFELFYRHRRALGMGIVALEDDRRVGEQLLGLMAQNELIALVCDRDLKGRGVEVEMFGEARRMPAGPALLSLATGAPVLPCACYDVQDGWVIHISPPLEIERTGNMRDDVATLTRRLAEEFERSIASAPTQWHMFQPAWKPTERPAAERPTDEAAGA